MTFVKTMIVGLVVVFAFSATASAKEQYAAGTQSLWVSTGLSGQYFINDKLRAQAYLGFGGFNTDIGARALYILKEKDQYNFYGAGGALFQMGSVSGLEMAGAVGVEVDVRKWLKDFIPLWLSWEIGAGYSTAHDLYNIIPLRLNGGLHYRF